jgi:predicted chitinase
MAEVTGDLGGQPIQLNNAATEATLKQLLAAMLAQVAMQNKGTKKDNATQKELEKELTRLAGSAKAVAKANDDLSKSAKKQYDDSVRDAAARKKAADLEQQQIKNLQLTSAATNAFANGLEAGIEKLAKTVNTFSNLNSSFTSAASAMSTIPLVGGALATVFGTVAQAGERTYKSFQQASSVGANFGGSINAMIQSATGAGLTFDQFSAVIAKNGENIAMMATSAEDGASRLGKLGKELRSDRFKSVNADLARLGYTTEDTNGGMARYAGLLAKTGQLEGKSNAELVQGSADYLKNLDQLSKLTGKSKDALKAEQDALMADAAYRIRLSNMDPKGQEELNKLMLATPKHMQAGLKEIITFGSATTDAGREYTTFMQKSAGTANNVYAEIERTGTLSAKTAQNMYDVQKGEATALIKTPTAKLLSNVGNSMQQSLILGASDLAAQSGNLGDAQKKQADELAAAAKRQQDMKDAIDPAQLQKFQTLIAEINNQFTEMAARFMPELQSAFERLSSFVKAYILPVFEFMMSHIEAVIGALVVFKLAALGMKTYLAVKEFKASLRGASASTPMFVKDVSGGLGGSNAGGVGGGKDGKGGKGGKGGAILDVATTALMVGGIGNMVAGPITDSLMDVTGASKELTDEMTAQDSANWARATFWEKLQSGAARGIEKAGDIFGLNKLAERAKVDRIQAETEYLRNKGRDTAGTTTSAGPTTNLTTAVLPAGPPTTDAAAAAYRAEIEATGKQTANLTAAAAAQKAEIEATEKQTALLQQELKLQLQAIAAEKLKASNDKTAAFNEKHNQELQRRKAEIEARLAANMKKTSAANEELAKTTEKLTEEENKKLKDAEAAKPAEAKLNFSSPQALFDSFKKKMSGGSAEPTVAPPSGTTGTIGTPPPLKQDQAQNMELIKAALQKQGITDPKYIAATLGNVMKETGGKSINESLNYGKTDNSRIRQLFGSRVAGKSDAELDAVKGDESKMGEMVYGKDTVVGKQMGNTEAGDGFKYRGRGFIQLTGKSNYSAASKAIYGDDRLVKNPDMVNDPQVAADVAAWYMKRSQGSMAQSMGINTANMTQDQANLLATSQIAGQDVRRAGGYLGGENLAKASAFATQMAGIAGSPVIPGAPTPVQVAAATPNAQTASSAITPAALAAVPATTTQQAARVEAVLAGANRPGTGAPGAGGGSPMNEVVAQLEMLNSKVASLVRINNDALNVGQNQLRAAREASGNLFMA